MFIVYGATSILGQNHSQACCTQYGDTIRSRNAPREAVHPLTAQFLYKLVNKLCKGLARRHLCLNVTYCRIAFDILKGQRHIFKNV